MTARNRTAKKRQPRWAKGFLAALRDTANVRRACEVANVGRRTVYDYRSEHPEFAAQWYAALDEAADLLEEEARRRAYEGVHRLKFDRGNVITIPIVGSDGKPMLDQDDKPLMVPYVEHEYSDTLLIFLLKGARPEVYRERTDVRHSGHVNVKELSDDELRAIVEGTSGG